MSKPPSAIKFKEGYSLFMEIILIIGGNNNNSDS